MGAGEVIVAGEELRPGELAWFVRFDRIDEDGAKPLLLALTSLHEGMTPAGDFIGAGSKHRSAFHLPSGACEQVGVELDLEAPTIAPPANGWKAGGMLALTEDGFRLVCTFSRDSISDRQMVSIDPRSWTAEPGFPDARVFFRARVRLRLKDGELVFPLGSKSA